MSWDELATTALVGTARRSLETAGLPAALTRLRPAAADEPRRLLELAALATVYRRAGVRPGPVRAGPEPAPDDPRPVAGAAAQARLAAVLAMTDDELLVLWLKAAAGRGLRPPDHLLPALLGRATTARSAAGPVAGAVGPRGAWLAAQRSDWALALAAAGAGEPDLPPDAWQVGTPAQRLSWLRARRAEDPGGARDLLAAGWRQETYDQRAALLAVLEHGLGPGDEDFLESSLDDRRAEVRAGAARLLARLPGSGFQRRVAGQALAAVRLKRVGLHRGLVVEPPEPSPQLARDQIAVRAPAAVPAAAWLVLNLVSAAPLSTWSGLGSEQVTGYEVHDGWRTVLWQGWARAARRERHPGWARALIAAHPPPGVPYRARDDTALLAGAADLLALLPPAERTAGTARLVRGYGIAAAALLAAVEAPWPAPLAAALLDVLTAQPQLSYEAWPVLNLAHRMPAEFAGPLRAAADRLPAASPVPRRLQQAADLITFRTEMLQELQ